MSNPICIDALPLNNKDVKRIQGLQKFKNAKSLNLSHNDISKIENIDHMKYMQMLEI